MTAMLAPQGGGMSFSPQKNKIPRGYEEGRMQQFTPEQMQILQQRMQQLGPESFLAMLSEGNPEMFEQMEAPAMRQFAQLQGQNASRFSGLGMGGSGRKSSGFQNATGQMASDFAQQLQGNRTELQNNAIRDLMGMSSNLLQQRPYEQFLTKKQPTWWQSLIGGAAPVAGAAIGGYFGDVPGAKAGARIGGAAGQAFMGG